MTNKNFISNVPSIKTLATNDNTDLNNVKTSISLSPSSSSAAKNLAILSKVAGMKTVADPLTNTVIVKPKVVTNAWIRSITRSLISVDENGNITKIQYLGFSPIILIDDFEIFTQDGTYITWKINLNYDDQIYTNISNFFIEVRWAGSEDKSRAYTGSISGQRNALTDENERAVYVSLDTEFGSQYTVELYVYGVSNTAENNMLSLLGIASSVVSNFEDLGDIFSVTSGQLTDAAFTAQRQAISGTTFTFEHRYTTDSGYSIQDRTLDIVGSVVEDILCTSIMSINEQETTNKIFYNLKEGQRLEDVFAESLNLQFKINSDGSLTLSNNEPGINYLKSEVLPTIRFADEKGFNDLILIKDSLSTEEHSVRFIFISQRPLQQILDLTDTTVKGIGFVVGNDVSAVDLPRLDQLIQETNNLGIFELAFEPSVVELTPPLISTQMQSILGNKDSLLFLTLTSIEASSTYVSDPIIFANYAVSGSPNTTLIFLNDGIQDEFGEISTRQLTFGQFETVDKAPFVILNSSGQGNMRFKIPNIQEGRVTLRFNIKGFTYASLDPITPSQDQDEIPKFSALVCDNLSKFLSVNWNFTDGAFASGGTRYATIYKDLTENSISYLCDQMSVQPIVAVENKTLKVSETVDVKLILANGEIRSLDLITKQKNKANSVQKLIEYKPISTKDISIRDIEDETEFEISTSTSVRDEGYTTNSTTIEDRNVGSTFTSAHSGLFYNEEKVPNVINNSPNINMDSSNDTFLVFFDEVNETLNISRLDGDNKFFIGHQVLASVVDSSTTISTVIERNYTESNNPIAGDVCVLKLTSLDVNGDSVPFDPSHIDRYVIIFDDLHPGESFSNDHYALVQLATVEMSVVADQISPPTISFSQSIGSNMILAQTGSINLYQNTEVDEINDRYTSSVTLTGTAINLGEFAYYLIIPESITSDTSCVPRETVSMLNSADFVGPGFITYKFTFKNETHISKFIIKKLIPEVNILNENIIAILNGIIVYNGDPNQTIILGDIQSTGDGAWQISNNRSTGSHFFGNTTAEDPTDLRHLETTSPLISAEAVVVNSPFNLERGFNGFAYLPLNPMLNTNLQILQDASFQHTLYSKTMKYVLENLDQTFKIGMGCIGDVFVETVIVISRITGLDRTLSLVLALALPILIAFSVSGIGEIARYLRKKENDTDDELTLEIAGEAI